MTFQDYSAWPPFNVGIASLVNGVATFTTSGMALGNHSIVAIYSGDAVYDSSMSTAVAQTVSMPVNTAITLTSSSDPSAYGQLVTFTATVVQLSIPGAPPVPTPGTVTFMDGTQSLGIEPVSTNTATLSINTLAAGTHSITAIYSGDPLYNTSISTAVAQVVHAPLVSTTTVLTSSANPSVYNQWLTFTIAVAPSSGTGTPTGTVTLSDNGVALSVNPPFSTYGIGWVPGSDTISISTSSLAIGTNVITAVYSGDSNYSTSTATIT